MKANLKTIRKILTVGLFMAIALLGFLKPAMAARNPKIHVLFVWGTASSDTEKNCEFTKTVFEKEMANIGIKDGGKYIASFTSLSGADAHPKKILENCQRMASEAGPDDTLFVYILCHGVSVHLGNVRPEDRTDENRVHVLSPVAPDGAHMNLGTVGIKRASIIKAMKGGNHRLNVLITDSCSNYVQNIVRINPRVPPYPVLLYVLLNSQGTINWNSTDPNGGNTGQGERSLICWEGTNFSRAFIAASCEMVSDRVSPDDFFNRLGAALTDSFNQSAEEMREEIDGDAYSYQGGQTLTKFDDNGHAIQRWNESLRGDYKYEYRPMPKHKGNNY